LLDLLFLIWPNKKGNPDTWTSEKCDAIAELASALSVLVEIGELRLETQRYWTAELAESVGVVVVDGEQSLHWSNLAEKYVRELDSAPYAPPARTRAVLIVALRSIGYVHQMIDKFSPDTTKPQNRNLLGASTPFEPTRATMYVCGDVLFVEARRQAAIAPFLRERMGTLLG
jgi:hypothetical protein